MASAEHVATVVQFFESLTPQSVAHIRQLYASEAVFKDPFNEVRGTAAIERIFAHMFESLYEPRFVVTQQVLQGPACFLTWDFEFRFKRFDSATLQCIKGASHLQFDEAGRISLHRDYWDAAEELYEKLPVLGGLMRWLKKRANS
jgi:ketosteroid isomerase-like protein